MESRIERRKSQPNPDDELSPEALALLESCGGSIRASDRALLEQARAQRMPDRRSDDRIGGDRRSRERRAAPPGPGDKG